MSRPRATSPLTHRIAFLGPHGTYADTACAELAGIHGWQDHSRIAGRSIQQVIHMLEANEVQAAVVPVENSVEGGVAATLDALWRGGNLRVRRALVLPIRHALVSSGSLEGISEVLSHPQALGQCSLWLAQQLPQALQLPTNSTVEAARMARGSRFRAAIASLNAAEEQGLKVLAHPVNDVPNNCTRFLLLTPAAVTPGNHGSGHDRASDPAETVITSLAFSLHRDRPGGLMEALRPFAERELNLTRIESRPAKREMGEYVFFVDVHDNQQTSAFEEVVRDLEPMCERLVNFGSYGIIDRNLDNRDDAEHAQQDCSPLVRSPDL